MIKVEVRIPQDIRKMGDKLLPTQQDMKEMAGDAMNTIKKRTLSGTDVNGSPFERYSKDYGEWKAGKGRSNEKGLNVNATAVNLYYTGAMMRSLSIEGIPNGARLFFRDRERSAIAYYHQTGQGDNPQREFFGLSDSEMRQLTDKLFTKLRARAAK